MTLRGRLVGGRLRAAGRAAAAALAVMAVMLAQMSVPELGAIGTAHAASQEMSARKTGYGSDKSATFTYVKDDLSLEKAQFKTTNAKAIAFTSGNKYLARTRGANKVDKRRGCVYILGESGTGKKEVKGSFTLTWSKAVSDAFGKRYDLKMTVTDIEYENPTGISFKDGIAIMNGPLVARYDIDSSEETNPELLNKAETKRTNRRIRTVSPDVLKNGKVESSVGAQTQVCGRFCGRDNIKKMHETFYTGIREGDTWDGKTWVNGKKTKVGTKWPGDGWTKDWKTSQDWAPRAISKKGGTWKAGSKATASADENNMMVGVSMKISTKVVSAGTDAPVTGGTLGTAFRDIDQGALGKPDDDYKGSYAEGIRFESGFSGSCIYVDEETTLQTGNGRLVKELSPKDTFTTVKGTAVTGNGKQGDETKHSGFTCKGNAQGFSFTWSGSLCATSLFTPTNIGPTNLDISVRGTKKVDGHDPGNATFEFWLYRGQATGEAKDTPVKLWGNGNEKLDADGNSLKKGGKSQGVASAKNDSKGKFAIRLGYWTLMHALGYPDRDYLTDDLTEKQRKEHPNYVKLGNDGLFGAGDEGHAGWYRFTIVEEKDRGAFETGNYVVDQGECTVWMHLTPDGKGGANVQVAYGEWNAKSDPADSGASASLSNLEKARASIAVNKRLVNDSPLPAPDIKGKYAFQLLRGTTTAAGVNAAAMPLPKKVTVQNPSSSGGSAAFGPMEFWVPGDYTYRIVESRSAAGGGQSAVGNALAFVKDDALAQTGKFVTVRVRVGSDGHKHAEVVADKRYAYKSSDGSVGVEFSNVYAPPSLELPVEKTLVVGSGAQAPDIKGKFTFTLTGGADSPMPRDGKTSVKNPDSTGGTASFGKIWYAAPGTFVYAVMEKGSVDGVYNDATSSKGVSVVVSDSGQVTVNEGKGIGFSNYVPSPAVVTLGARKVLVCDVPGARFPDVTGRFSFHLKGETPKAPMPEKTEVVNPDSTGGTAWFGTVSFDREGTYGYRVTEKGKVQGVNNDPKAKEGKSVSFHVAYDRAANRLVAVDGEGRAVSKTAFEFDNTYVPSVAMPLAGGRCLWALVGAAGAIALACGAALLIWRRRASR